MSYSRQSYDSSRWLKLIAALLFFSFIGTTEYIIYEYKRNQQADLERSASELAIRLKSQLETELNGTIFLTHGIEAYVIARNGDIVPDEINSMLEQVYQFSPFFRNIGIAPDNKLSWIIPLEGNEAALGLNYEKLPSQWPSIKQIIESNAAALNGPLPLVQGGLGLIYRAPVYLNDNYWGMISAVIDADSLFQSLMGEIEQSEMSAKLGLRHASGINRDTFLGDSSVFTDASATTVVETPSGDWQLAITVNEEQPNLWPARFIIWSLAFAGVLGIYFLTRHVYQQKLLNSLSTQVKDRTKELSDVNSKLNHVLNAATETAIIATDKTGVITVFNRGAERMLGYSADEVVGKTTPAIFHDADEVAKKKKVLTAQLGRDISGFSVFTAVPDIDGSEKDSWTYISKSGKRIPVELIVTKEFNNDGNAVGYLGLVTDISQHVFDQQSLKELKERLESATKVANIGVWELDLKSHKMLWNEQMYALTGLAHNDFHGQYQSIKPVFCQEERQEFDELLNKLKRKAVENEPFIEPPPALETTFRIVRTDNQELRWMKGHAVILCDESGVPRSMLGAMHEISSLVFAKEAAEQAERLKSQFLSTVSHELRTPLSVISGALSLLSFEEKSFSEETKNVLDLASRNSKRLTLLINDLLDIEKLTSGNLTFKFQEHSLKLLLEQAIEENCSYVAQQNAFIKFNNRLSADAFIVVDQLRFVQVMTNLISNAAKFSPDGGEVQVTASITGQNVLIEIIDHGSGIPEAFKNRVFEPFAQAQSSDSRNKGGTGLGLAITKTIIEKMEGAIGFDSKPNQKTRFWFSLPTKTNLSNKKSVLHVEDSDDFSAVITAILKDNYEVDTACSIQQAKQKLLSNKYDVLIFDILSPDSSGYDIIEIANSTHEAIKIVVTSDPEVSLEKASRVDAIMDKANFTRTNFVELIDKLAGNNENRRPHV
ncbi:ATP-binding protein [Pseudidiomarina sp. E22-M8]|uniref:ATP-binding protein n=1 Tax=Pseudidiomarina sp. E22-M8 TaxID=3424768 RepID=UPI00403C83A1